MAQTIKVKRSAVAGKVPLTTDIDLGELAINTYDGKLFLKKNNGADSIVEVGSLAGFAFARKTSNYTASHKDFLYCDTSAGSFTVTLPATPSEGHTVIVVDAKNYFGTNNLTIDRNGSTIEGDASNMVLSIASKQYTIAYLNSSWRIYVSDAFNNVNSPVYLQGPTAGNEGTDVTLIIKDWNYTYSYVVSVTGGSYTRTTDKIVWNLPSVESNTIHTLTLSVTGVGSYDHYVNVLQVNTNADTSVAITNFASGSYNEGWTI